MIDNKEIIESFEEEHGISDKSPRQEKAQEINEASGKYNHKWSYAAGKCECINKECGLKHPHYMVPGDKANISDFYVSSTPGGRGEVLEILREACDVYTELDGEEILLESFMDVMKKAAGGVKKIATKSEDTLIVEEFREDHIKPKSFVDIPGKVKDKSVDDLGMIDKKDKDRRSVSNYFGGGYSDREYSPIPTKGETRKISDKADGLISALGRSIINDHGYVTPRTMNIISNIMTDVLAKENIGFKSLRIRLLPETSKVEVEFTPPTPSADFVQRFVDGKESIGKFLRRSPVIHVKINKRVFMKKLTKGDQLVSLIHNMIKWYSEGIELCMDTMVHELLKTKHDFKQLLVTTPLSGLITFPLSMLMVFDDVNPDELEMKEITKTVHRFYKTITLAPTADKQEQQKIVDDLRKAISEVSKLVEYNEFVQSYQKLPEAVQTWCEGGYQSQIDEIEARWMAEQCEPKIYTEAPKVKKLKKIPSDIIAYVLIEGEAIRDANDKFLILSYAYSRIDLIEWYIELLDVGSTRYIVPHTKLQLVSLRNQLLAAIDKIMKISIPSPSSPVVNINYPHGYEG